MNPWLSGTSIGGVGYNPLTSMFGGSGFEATDPYSLYTKGALPRQPTYPSAAYDALGNKIWAASPPPTPTPGVTLNSTPSAPAGPSLASISASNPMMAQEMGWQALSAPEQFMAGNVAGDPGINWAIAATLGGPQGGAQAGMDMMRQQAPGLMNGSTVASGPGAPSGASTSPSPAATVGGYDPTNQGYLKALTQAGTHVQTPGAPIPAQGSTITNMLDRLQKPTGISLNTNFVNALRSMYPRG